MIIMEEEESSNTVLHAVDIRADILEDILWRVGPVLQHGVFISTMTICCNLDLPQMT